jgi:hypothetical protein
MMTGGPTPVAGDNPYTGLYQTGQFDSGYSGVIPRGYAHGTPFDALADPPEGAIDAATSPDHLYEENTDPPVGAGG